jgi:hypothetical protein
MDDQPHRSTSRWPVNKEDRMKSNTVVVVSPAPVQKLDASAFTGASVGQYFNKV